MVNGHFREANEGQATFENVDPEVFAAACEFAYTKDYDDTREKVRRNKSCGRDSLDSLEMSTATYHSRIPFLTWISFVDRIGDDTDDDDDWSVLFFDIEVYRFANLYLYNALQKQAYMVIEDFLDGQYSPPNKFDKPMMAMDLVYSLEELSTEKFSGELKSSFVRLAVRWFEKIKDREIFKQLLDKHSGMAFDICCSLHQDLKDARQFIWGHQQGREGD